MTPPDEASGLTDFEQAAADAEKQIAPEPQEETQETQAAEPEKPAVEAAPEAPQEETPWTKWVKSVSGNVGPDGQIIPDRIHRQAYELNRQNQKTAQEIAEYRRLLSDPKVAEAIRAATSGAEVKAKEQPEEREKTDEQILQEFVEQKAKELFEREYGPRLRDADIAWQRQFESDMVATRNRLDQEFGKDEYESVKEEVGQAIAHAAAEARLHPVALLQDLSRRNRLYDTLASAARNALYPKIRQAAVTAKTAAENAQVAKAKSAKLPGKGTPAQAVNKSHKINSFQDALEAALEENPDFRALP